MGNRFPLAAESPNVAVSSFLGNSMGPQLANNYLNDHDRYKKISSSLTKGVISEALKYLLKAWARQSNLHFTNQYEFISVQKPVSARIATSYMISECRTMEAESVDLA